MPEIFGFDPIQEFNNTRDALRQLVESGMIMPRDLMPSAVATMILPIDLVDDGPQLIVQTNLPGLKPEEVVITVVGTTLTIKATLEKRDDFPGSTYLRRERRAGVVARSITLPVEVESEKAEAKFNNGVLTLTLPKSESVRPKTIRVSAG
jgi:HSP20 family protein